MKMQQLNSLSKSQRLHTKKHSVPVLADSSSSSLIVCLLLASSSIRQHRIAWDLRFVGCCHVLLKALKLLKSTIDTPHSNYMQLN